MTRKFSEERDIIKLAILAIGGQGGGVLADWIVHLAEAQRLLRADDVGSGRRATHRRDDLLSWRLVPETGRTPVLS